MHARPSFFADFLNDYGYLDPRIVFGRASTGTYCDRNGILRSRSNSNPRFNFQPSTGLPLGLLLEPTNTNLLLQSEDFTSGLWANTACTVTANVTAAPDGNTTADLVTANANLPGMSQSAIAITAGNSLYLSVFAKKAATNFMRVNFNDGTNFPTAWFDLNLGVVTSHTAGAGTCTYANAMIEPWPNGWYRCSLAVATSTVTSMAIGIHPAGVDGSNGLTGDAAYFWGAMLVQQATVSGAGFGNVPSYIATAGAQGTRAIEICYLNLPDPSWYDPTQGTLFVDFSLPIGCGVNSGILLGTGNTLSDYILLQAVIRSDLNILSNLIYASSTSGGVTTSVSDSGAITAFDTPYRAALGFKQGDYTTLCVSGRPVLQTATVPALPATPARMTIGGNPAGIGVNCGMDIRRVAYFPRKLTNAQLQKLTA